MALLALLKAVKMNHHEIEAHLLLIDGGALYDDFCQSATVIRLKKKKNLLLKIKRILFDVSYKEDYNELKSQSYDYIFANSVASLPSAIKLKEKLGCQLFLYVHELSLVMRKLGVSILHLQQCDVLIAASEAAKKNLIENYNIADNKITVIYPPLYNTIETILTKKEEKKEHSVIIGISGTGCWGKGIDLLPFIIKELKTTYPELNYRFMWVGHLTEETKINIEYDLKRLNLLDKLTIIGEVELPLVYYSKFDILLVLSREESFSLSCVECIELGIPIVCMHETLGIVNLIGEQSLISVPYLSIKDIAKALYGIITDEKLRTDLINTAREQLSNMYSPEKSINSIIKLFKQNITTSYTK